jgi:hypothetical protein
MTLKASVVPKACLPSVLAVLMYLELVSRGAVDYLQSIQVTTAVGLPPLGATLPSGIGWDVTLAGSTALDIVKRLALVVYILSEWRRVEHIYNLMELMGKVKHLNACVGLPLESVES